MKKYFISSVMALAISAVFTGCSKSNDLYDEGAVQQSKQDQKIAEYNAAFEKAFGKVAVGNDWGFGAAKFTRGSVIQGFTQYDIRGLHKPNNGRGDRTKLINDFNNSNEIVTDFNFESYFLQHAVKQTENGKSGSGSASQHQQMGQLQAYNYKEGKYEDVANFVGGKAEVQFINGNNETHGTTAMTNMGTPDGQIPQFRWIASSSSTEGEGYVCTNYIIKKVNGEIYLGLSYENIPKEGASNDPSKAYNKYDAWIIRLLEAKANPGYTAFGRVMCEDLGSTEASDLDFNDVVFDAYIMNDGSINIIVLAAGGVLRPITIGGITVTLPKMSNTGGEVVADYQEFTIPASVALAEGNKWTSIDKIPVVVPGADGEPMELISKSDGSAPAKVCTYVGVPWAKERIKLSDAYKNWTTYVTTTNPQIWYGNQVQGTTVPLFFDEDE